MALLAAGGYVPDDEWTNERLVGRVPDTTAEWIHTRTGIGARRFASQKEATSDLAVRASREALRRAEVSATSLDLILVATSTPDHQLPSCASLVQAELGASACMAFDVNATCSGFVHALDVARRYVLSDAGFRYALVIGADVYSRILDWKDRSTAVLFGDGAGAVLLAAPDEAPEAPRIVRSWFSTDGSRAGNIIVPGGGSRDPLGAKVFQMHGATVKAYATSAFEEIVRTLCEAHGISVDALSTVVPHQANARIIEKAMQNLGVPIERAVLQLHKYGNTAAASIPLALSEFWTDVRRAAPGYVALVSFGGGLSCGGLLISKCVSQEAV